MLDLSAIDLLTLPSVPLSDRRLLPSCPAIYFVVDGDRVLYIGKAKKLRERWRRHPVINKLKLPVNCACVAWIQVEDCCRLEDVESLFICKYRPALNIFRPFRIVPGRIRQLRINAGIQQTELSKALGMRQSYLSALERSAKSIPLDTLNKLCVALRCQPGDLLVWVPDEDSK